MMIKALMSTANFRIKNQQKSWMMIQKVRAGGKVFSIVQLEANLNEGYIFILKYVSDVLVIPS